MGIEEEVDQCADEGCAACQLSLCAVCKGFEGSLPTHCPGEPMDGNLQTDVYVGEINYVDGQWRKKA